MSCPPGPDIDQVTQRLTELRTPSPSLPAASEHTTVDMDAGPPLLRPLPRRAFELTPASTESSAPPTPASEPNQEGNLDVKSNGTGTGGVTPSRTRSILNLTSSTLFGIYSPTGYDNNRDEPATPWGTGAETPAETPHGTRGNSMDEARPNLLPATSVNNRRPSLHRMSSAHQRHSFKHYYLPLLLRVAALFVVGLAYGGLVTHLHDQRTIVPVQVEGIDQRSWLYLGFWGGAGVASGSLLPWVDELWLRYMGPTTRQEEWEESARGHRREKSRDEVEAERVGRAEAATEWNLVVRSIGAFLGIAFAIVSPTNDPPSTKTAISVLTRAIQRKLPWQSTLQLSLTLALANPAIWYLLDRSRPGFVLSSLVALSGTAILLGINPALVPNPATRPNKAFRNATGETGAGTGREGGFVGGWVSYESIGVATWIASVLFCSCVCFGNIGRRLAPKRGL
ncbi:hypothetical protein B0A49_00186 [Cryomyces minteri]|uniref:Insulin-induced gene 1 protein n=1 Tax=Cryomyces minteri TaxID=331657 RepID=A0A4V5NI86_9PEZI|nr:hypothetical protein B0A49_00186 [Cryomyces minteri]